MKWNTRGRTCLAHILRQVADGERDESSGSRKRRQDLPMKPKSRNRLFYPLFPRDQRGRYSALTSRLATGRALGKGRFGRVYELPEEGRAVKVMRKCDIVGEGLVDQVLEEQQNHSLCSQHHPNVLSLVDSSQARGTQRQSGVTLPIPYKVAHGLL